MKVLKQVQKLNKVTHPNKVKEIDAQLPQTQCGLCGYAGCMPYAEALNARKAAIDLCPPGGIKTMEALAKLLTIDPEPYRAAMLSKAKPRTVARIREEECIGCVKCIKVCPVDAILGSAKRMHTVINDECTGCELCVPACPVDCIDLVKHPQQLSELDSASQSALRNHSRKRFIARNKRLAAVAEITLDRQSNAKIMDKIAQPSDKDKESKLLYIQAAILRAKAKKTYRGK